MKTWQCIVCGFVYDEEEGWEEDGIPPGTAWDDVPEDVTSDGSVGANQENPLRDVLGIAFGVLGALYSFRRF